MKLLEWLLARHASKGRTKLKQLLKNGAVAVNGTVVTAFDRQIGPSDRVEILSKSVATGLRLKKTLPFTVLYEDEALVAIDKPAGLLTMATDKEREQTAYFMLTDYVRAKSSDGRGRVFIVHRLDREASGVVLFAKNERAKRELQEGWETAVKYYDAVVEGVPADRSGEIDARLAEDEKTKRVYVPPKKERFAKDALTRWRLVRSGREFSLLDVELVTGRKHQIRVHLAHAGHPLAGDSKYGATSETRGRIGLHARSLEVTHPFTGKRLRIEAPFPRELEPLVA